MQSLPEHIVTEAQVLRERAAANVQRQELIANAAMRTQAAVAAAGESGVQMQYI